MPTNCDPTADTSPNIALRVCRAYMDYATRKTGTCSAMHTRVTVVGDGLFHVHDRGNKVVAVYRWTGKRLVHFKLDAWTV